MSQESIDFETLADWAEGRLPEAEARAIEGRLAAADDGDGRPRGWLWPAVLPAEDVFTTGRQHSKPTTSAAPAPRPCTAREASW